jgi:glycine oxidase
MNVNASAIVIGGGIIGSSIAYELAKSGMKVTLLDKGAVGQEASTAAAGMLGAQVETHHPGAFYELCTKSQELYRPWSEELFAYTGISPQYIDEGILRVALTEEDEAELRGRLPWIRHAQWVSPEEIRRREPQLTEAVRGGLWFDRDHQVHPIHLMLALRASLVKRGVTIREWTPVFRLLQSQGRITGVQTSEGPLYADHVVLAAGAWSPALTEAFGMQLPMFPVQGQCLSIRTEAPLLTSTAFTKGCYIVPKQDGSCIVGATQVEAGFDKRSTAEAVARLQDKAVQLVPKLKEAEFLRTWTGLRPGSRDGLPFLGTWDQLPGLVFATGHYRNGILLAPVTAVLIRELLTGGSTSLNLAPFSPERAAEAAKARAT